MYVSKKRGGKTSLKKTKLKMWEELWYGQQPYIFGMLKNTNVLEKYQRRTEKKLGNGPPRELFL